LACPTFTRDEDEDVKIRTKAKTKIGIYRPGVRGKKQERQEKDKTTARHIQDKGNQRCYTAVQFLLLTTFRRTDGTMGGLSSKESGVVVRESGMKFEGPEDRRAKRGAQQVEQRGRDNDTHEFQVLQIDGKNLVDVIRGKEASMVLVQAVAPFDDLSLHDVEGIWAKVFDVAESFAVNERQLRSILSVLAPSLGK
jgi:hypothetical protein